MKKEEIIRAVEAAVAERGCFIVDVTVSAANDVEIVLEKEEGIVDWNDCAAIDMYSPCSRGNDRLEGT